MNDEDRRLEAESIAAAERIEREAREMPAEKRRAIVRGALDVIQDSAVVEDDEVAYEAALSEVEDGFRSIDLVERLVDIVAGRSLYDLQLTYGETLGAIMDQARALVARRTNNT